jgi:type VI protein secretion system component VasF
MNPAQHTVAQVYARLDAMIHQRNDTGFRLALSDAVLQTKNPFETKKKRPLKVPIAIAFALLVVLVLIFVYFSFLSGR